ncbi:MAG TPA: translation initiation factor IF-2 [Ignavibacteria bacterium]|nr:translation initiation factor IF-2 [Ignavibacteria bacterium]
MAETKPKKIKIFKFASENNLSAKELVEFLSKKGHKVKSIMSPLSEEMIEDISAHYKKDIDKALKHYKKIAEIKKKKSDKEEKDASTVTIEPEVKEEVEEDTLEETEEVKLEVEKEEEEKKEETVTEEKEEPEVEKSEEEDKFRTPVETEIANRKGLKVIGKMDLEDKKTEKKTTKKEDEDSDAASTKAKKKKRIKGRKKKQQDVKVEIPVKKKKRIKKFEINEKDVKAAIRKTMMSIDDNTSTASRASYRKKKRKEREEEEEKIQEQKSLEAKKIRVNEFSAVNELANLMEIPVGDVIAKCMELGIMVSINQRLDVETITLVADEFDFEVEFVEEFTSDLLADTPDDPDTLEPRPPVVTIMGHVDHGKTSLLDYIRKENVVEGESGGITQHIGAYRVDAGNEKQIAFLDTPGHEAFTAMRARGAQATDIVVLIIAADDAVMPQTVEAINHAQAANVPIVIAINKIDKPGANPEKIKQQLADRNILVEAWGGKYQCVEISAKTGLNIDNLLETILLEAELLELKANYNRSARGIVVEAQLDKGRGVTGTILVEKGTLKIGNPFVAGIYQGKVRAMFDEKGNKIFKATPSTPVLVLGFEGTPQAGDTFIVVDSERQAREIGLKRQQLKREQDQKQVHHITLDEIAKQISIGGVKELPLIVKGDVDGSVEALSDSLMKLSTEEVKVRVIHKGVGGISEGDVLLASASHAIIVGFHVRPNLNARKLAEKEKVDIRLYSVIYDTINEVKSALEGLLSPIISEEVTATVEVRDIFKVPKVGTVAGCYVLEGKVTRNNKVRLIRDGIVIHQGEINALRRFKDDVKEVDAGYECGISINNYNDLKVSDIIEAYKMVETKKKLD